MYRIVLTFKTGSAATIILRTASDTTEAIRRVSFDELSAFTVTHNLKPIGISELMRRAIEESGGGSANDFFSKPHYA